MNKAEQAAVFCEEILTEFEKTNDPEEKLILLGVLTNKLNEWSLAMRLDAIQRGSREQSRGNEKAGH